MAISAFDRTLPFDYTAGKRAPTDDRLNLGVYNTKALIEGTQGFERLAAASGTSTVTGAQDNYSADSLASDPAVGVTLVLWNGSSDVTFSGFADGIADRVRLVVNKTTGNYVTLAHQSSGSSAANRIVTTTGVPVTIGPGGMAILIYDGAQSRWLASLAAQNAMARIQAANGLSTDQVLRILDHSGLNDWLVIRNDGIAFCPLIYADTTATAANVVVTSSGELQRSTSTRRMKQQIKAIDQDDARRVVRRLQAVTFRSRCARDDRRRRHAGLIAEDVAEVAPLLVTRDAAGRPNYVQYDRLGAYLLPVVQALDAEVQALKAEVRALRTTSRRRARRNASHRSA